VILTGEKQAVETVIQMGRQYGFGNLIGHLKRAWALMLIENYNQSWDNAVAATNVDAYPQDYAPFKEGDHFTALIADKAWDEISAMSPTELDEYLRKHNIMPDEARARFRMVVANLLEELRPTVSDLLVPWD